MPDIIYRFVGDDQLTPMINQLKAAIASLVSQGKTGGAGVSATGTPGPSQGAGNLAAQMNQAQVQAGGLTSAINNARSATAALSQETKLFTAQLELGKKIFDALQKQIPGITVERAKGMLSGSPQDVGEQSAALDAYVAHQKRAQQDIAEAIELAEVKQQFRREERLDRNAQVQIQHLERQARKEAQYQLAPPVVTKIPTPRVGAFGQMGDDLEKVGTSAQKAGGHLNFLLLHLARMPLYIGIFEGLRVATEALENAFAVTVGSVEDYTHWMNIVGSSNAAAGASFNDLKSVALDTWTTIAETQKRAMAFIAAGSTPAQAIQQAGAVQEGIRETGIDLTDAYAKTQLFGEGLKEAFDVGMRHRQDRPEILQHAVEDAQFQNTLKYREFDMQKRQHDTRQHFEDEKRGQNEAREDRQEAANYELMDAHRAQTYAMEDSHRAVRQQAEDKRTAMEDNLADTEHAEDRAMELRHTAVERETEDRHTALEREMQDRHTAESRAQQDAQAMHQERLAIAQSVGGAEQAVAEGRGIVMGQIGKKRVRVPIPASVQATIQAEQEEGYAELERQGVSRSEAQYMIRAHVMSPGALTHAAEAGRRRKADEEDRRRDDEVRAQERAFNDEMRGQGRQIHDESIALNERHYEQRRDTSRSLRDDERNTNRQQERDQQEQNRRQTAETQNQNRDQRAENKAAGRAEGDVQRSIERDNYDEQQNLKAEGLSRDVRRHDELTDAQAADLKDYQDQVEQRGGLMEQQLLTGGGEAGGQAGGFPPIPHFREKSMFEGGQALKTKDDTLARYLQDLLRIFRS